MKKRPAIAFTAALMLLCSACGQNTDAVLEASSVPAGSALVISDSTDPSSQENSTTAGISPTTEVKGSDVASGSSGTGSVTPDNSHNPTNIVPPTSYVTGSPSGSAAPYTSGSKSKPTPSTTATSTTGRSETSQTTTRTNTTASTTTTTATAKSPWAYPYDVSEIIRECKWEIARVAETTHVGWVWGDSLTKEHSSWDQPDNTVLYTEYPAGYTFGNYVFDGDLKNYVFNELIPYYLENQERYSIKRCKIWFEPLPDHPGDYNIYFLFWPDSA